MKATDAKNATVGLWPVLRTCVKCWRVQVLDKQICSDCEAKGFSPDSKPVDVSYSRINHVVVVED